MKRFLCVLLLAICLVGTVSASAKAQDIFYEDHDFGISIGDDVLVMNSKTNKNDPVWLEAGIGDSEERLEMIQQMNILTLLFDKKSKK